MKKRIFIFIYLYFFIYVIFRVHYLFSYSALVAFPFCFREPYVIRILNAFSTIIAAKYTIKIPFIIF